MSYQVLYRRFRPNRFSDVAGQDHITSILRNQITSGNVSHAYLFSGSRGTGKTSTAKIFAQAVNCYNPQDGEPCGECEYCQSIKTNGLSNVVEIDAASNRGIDEIRDLKEKVHYMPPIGKYRVYIIDEVHMLTTEAFNALLKTLEEPPEHIIFIFATTEPHKVLPTILSRCQRFDFARLSQDIIVARMNVILNEIGYTADDRALYLIAENSDGAMRDALSYLDKTLNTSADNNINETDVLSALGLAASSYINSIAEAIVNEDPATAYEILNELLSKGGDVNQTITQLIEYFRALMIYANVEHPQTILGNNEALLESLDRCGKNIPTEMLESYVVKLSQIKNETRYLPNPRYLLEAAILGLSDRDRVIDSIHLNARIDQLERKIEQIHSQRLSEQIIHTELLPEKHRKKEPQKPTPSEKHTSESIEQNETVPLPQTDRKTIADIQKEIVQVAKYIHNKDRDIMMADIYQSLQVSAYDEKTLYLYPSGPAEHMMDVFDMKNGKARLEELLSERLNKPIQIEIVKGKQKETKDLKQLTEEHLGVSLKEIDIEID